MLRRVTASAIVAPIVLCARNMHFPLTRPPIDIEYMDSDPLEYAVRTESRVYGFDDMGYMRELAFVRINDNPTVGDFRKMTKDQRRDMFWGSDRQDFFRHLTWKVVGTPEHLYHSGCVVVANDNLPCILNNGCQCNHSLPFVNIFDGQTYGTCIACDQQHTGPTCERRRVACMNFGIETVDGNCSCSLPWRGAVCEDRICINTIGGKGPYNIAAPSSSNFCDKCMDGYRGLSCEQCSSNSGCPADFYCGQDALPHTTKKAFTCDVTSKMFLEPLGPGRHVGGRVVYQCESPSSFTKDDIVCTVSFYRVEENAEYIDPFFYCTAFECSVERSVQPVTVKDEDETTASTRLKAFTFFKGFFQVALLVLCVLVSVARYIPGPQTAQLLGVKISLVALVTTLCIYIFITVVLMSARPQDNVNYVSYKCKQASCFCAPNPLNSNYTPFCNGSAFGDYILPTVTHTTVIKCNEDTLECIFEPTDISTQIGIKCTASECVPNNITIPSHNTAITINTVGRTGSTWLILLMCLFSFAAIVGIHWSITNRRTKRFKLEFYRKFCQVDGDDDYQCINNSTTTSSGGSLSTAINTDPDEVRTATDVNNNPSNNINFNDKGALSERRGMMEMRYEEDYDDSDERSLLKSYINNEKILDFKKKFDYNDVNHLVKDNRKRKYSNSNAVSSNNGNGNDFVCLISCALKVEGITYGVAGSTWPCEKAVEKIILKDVNFDCKSGDVVALMGASGAGKTTLLDILAARKKSGTLKGKIRLNETLISGYEQLQQYRNLVGYVAQEDTLLPSLTVIETLLYAARLKLPAAFSSTTISTIVDALITSLRLTRCRDTIVGDGRMTRGLSGGEKRRVSIAVELVANPRILFLDEPTSGLDGTNAYYVMEVVSALSRSSPLRQYAPHFFSFTPIIIASIHQPSRLVFSKFNKVVLLSFGNVIYAGLRDVAHTSLLQRVEEARAQTSIGGNVSETLGKMERNKNKKYYYHNNSRENVYDVEDINANVNDEEHDIDNPAEILLTVDDTINDAIRELLASTHKSLYALSSLSSQDNNDNKRDNNNVVVCVDEDCDHRSATTTSESTPMAHDNGGAEADHENFRPMRVIISDSSISSDNSHNSATITHSLLSSDSSNEGAVMKLVEENKRFYVNTYSQFVLLTRRAASALMGSYYLIAAHSCVAFVMGLLMCLLYRSEPLDLPGALNRAGSITFLLLVQSFISLSALEQLMTERKLFVTERENGFYSTLPYLMSKIVVDVMPLRIIPAVLVGSIIYFPMGLRTDDGAHFLWFIFILLSFTCCMAFLVVCIGVVSNSFGSAALVSSIVILWNFVFGGMLVQADSIPSMFQPFRHLSPFYLAFESLLVSELDGQMCTFAPTDEAGRPSTTVIPLLCVQYLYNMGLHPDRFGEDIMILLLECTALILFSFFLLTKVSVSR